MINILFSKNSESYTMFNTNTGFALRPCDKVDGSWAAWFNKQTSRFDSYVVQWRPKSKHHKDTCSKRDRAPSLNTHNGSTINNEHTWEDLCNMQLRNQQTCTSDNHNLTMGRPILNLVSLHTYHRGFANATQVWLCTFQLVEVGVREKATEITPMHSRTYVTTRWW